MRRTLPLFLLLIALPAQATWWPSFSPRELRVPVGESAAISVSWYWTGFGFFPPQPEYSVRTVDPHIARGNADLPTARPFEFAVTGIAPGETGIARYVNDRPNGSDYVKIVVYCRDAPLVHAIEPVVVSRFGDQITLRALSSAELTTYRWYAGVAGDVSRPIANESAFLTFIPQSAGVHDYWVAAHTPCGVEPLAFRVDVLAPKRRAVR